MNIETSSEMEIINMANDRSVYLTYIKTVLEEYIDSLKLSKDIDFAFTVFRNDNLTRTWIKNRWSRHILSFILSFHIFKNVTDDGNTLVVQLITGNNVVIVKFKIATTNIALVQKEIEEAVVQTLQDMVT